MLLDSTLGPSNANIPIALDCLDNMLIKRRKKVSVHRVLAFTKRVATLALQVQHNSGIALLELLRVLMMVLVCILSFTLNVILERRYRRTSKRTSFWTWKLPPVVDHSCPN